MDKRTYNCTATSKNGDRRINGGWNLWQETGIRDIVTVAEFMYRLDLGILNEYMLQPVINGVLNA